jgi:uncharacterized cupin superfamily protein
MTLHLGNANTIELTYSEVAAEGFPAITTGVRPLDDGAGTAFGVWGAQPGVFIGAPHADEVFVVLSGAVTISTAGKDESVAAVAGDVVRLSAGEEVRWDVAETLRILYVFP